MTNAGCGTRHYWKEDVYVEEMDCVRVWGVCVCNKVSVCMRAWWLTHGLCLFSEKSRKSGGRGVIAMHGIVLGSIHTLLSELFSYPTPLF